MALSLVVVVVVVVVEVVVVAVVSFHTMTYSEEYKFREHLSILNSKLTIYTATASRCFTTKTRQPSHKQTSNNSSNLLAIINMKIIKTSKRNSSCVKIAG